MAQIFSKKLYNSKQWIKCRAAYIQSVFGICEHKGCNEPGLIAHHKVVLTPANIDDPSITLNWDNLEYLCLLHHNQTHGNKGEAIREGLAFNELGELVEI